MCVCVRVCTLTTSGKKMCSIVTGRAGEPIGLMHSFIGNCQHQSAAGASFVRLKEIALQPDISLCLWHTQQQPCSSTCQAVRYGGYCNLELNLIKTKSSCKIGGGGRHVYFRAVTCLFMSHLSHLSLLGLAVVNLLATAVSLSLTGEQGNLDKLSGGALSNMSGNSVSLSAHTCPGRLNY